MRDEPRDGKDNFHLEIIELPRNEEKIDFDASGSGRPIEYPAIQYKKSLPKLECPEDVGLTKLNAIRNTLDCLESSLKLSRGLEAEQWLRYSLLKTNNTSLLQELKMAEKRNMDMLNLFRQNVTNFGFGDVDDLPLNLKREVQRTWHRKYDALLHLSEQLKNEISLKDIILEEKCKQIDVLEQKLLNLAETHIQREETIKNICTKYLNLKKRKDEQEILLRGSIETLQDALQKVHTNVNPANSKMTLIPSKEALLAREMRRSDRLSRENSLLRGLLQEARHERRCTRKSRSCSPVSHSDNNES